MKLIYTDILKQWTNCWQEALFAGILFMVAGRQMNPILNWQKSLFFLHFADGVFIYYLLYVTLISRPIGFRREVALLPFTGFELLSGNFHYVIENVLLFIPFGILLCMTLYAYGRKCNTKMLFLISFLTSVSVELLQYAFSCGKSETDDVIANVTGAFIGYILIGNRLTGKWKI